MQPPSDASYAQLDDQPIRFQPVSEQNNVFYDPVQGQLLCLEKVDAALLVRVQSGSDPAQPPFSFRLKDCGEVKSVKFSPDCRVLAVQRSLTAVEFVNCGGLGRAGGGAYADVVEYSQTCKAKGAQILGFQWIAATEVLYVTDCGLELFCLTPEKRTLRLVKSAPQQCNWYVWHQRAATVVLSSGPLSNQFNAFRVTQSALIKSPRFEVDLPLAPSASLSSAASSSATSSRGGQQPLRERDVFLAELYGQLYLGVLKHYVKPGGGSATEIALYHQPPSDSAGNPRKTDLLVLQQGGRLAVSTVDNLVLVHHQRLQRSFAFDIALPAESDGYLRYHQPVAEGQPLACDGQQPPTQVYGSSWIFFLPDVIVDAQAGFLWRIRLLPERLSALMLPADPARCFHCLHLRAGAKAAAADVVRRLMQSPGQLPVLAYALDLLAAQETTAVVPATPSLPPLPALSSSSSASTASLGGFGHQLVGLPARGADPPTQSDLYVHLLADGPTTDADCRAQIAMVLEFVRALSEHGVPVQHFLFETLVRGLVTTRRFGELHQLIQYHVISDSKPIACLLLSLQSLYPPAHQLALDMMKRLGSANEEILEVLLSQGRVLSAVKFLRAVGKFDLVPAPKLLEVALDSGDSRQFYSVFRALEQRNARLRGSAAFAANDHCQRYVAHFVSSFGQAALGQLRAL